MAKKKGTKPIQAKNPRSKFGKERVSSDAERMAKKILITKGIFFWLTAFGYVKSYD